MVDYLVYPNFGLANSVVTRMNNLMGFPHAPTGTVAYAEPIEHDSDPGTYLVIRKSVYAPALGRYVTLDEINGELNPGELASIKTQEELEAEGAFPLPPFLQLQTESGEDLLLEDGTQLLLEA